MTDQAPPAPPEAAPRPRPPAGRARWVRRSLVAAALLLGVVVLGVDSWGASIDEPAASVRQPKAEGSVRYFVTVQDNRSRILHRHRYYDLFVGMIVSGRRDPSYGHWVRLDWGSSERPAIKNAQWDRTGVRVAFTSGHEVFVPARRFPGH
ncbi:hypothetical protein [Actinomadura sp. NEAU-AAG7]|uniref:hypothetical protein n=1 Tax=Actinomadura sp. NEAU-AAG7 TaxID=2839640 RepID=UPI001BE44B03|nr:hypothetical protein [Actinomadura sp. NEAU-AAG7]MBT2213970.1 hypothetical protein [Actinomadura sp. NEAU-AAG7]